MVKASLVIKQEQEHLIAQKSSLQAKLKEHASVKSALKTFESALQTREQELDQYAESLHVERDQLDLEYKELLEKLERLRQDEE